MKGTYFSELFLDIVILPPTFVDISPKLPLHKYCLPTSIESEKDCVKTGETGEVVACSISAEPVG